VAYTFLRYIGLILDTLSKRRTGSLAGRAEDVALAVAGRPHLRSERGFWALGEALVDAVIARYPTAFAGRLAGDTDEP